MKKSFLILGAAAMLMASCSNDEVIDTARGRAIGFTSFVNNSTRADLTKDNITDFAVWAVTYKNGETPSSIFLGDKVSRTSSRAMFDYVGTRYWVDGLNYRFSAIAPYAAYEGGKNAPLQVVQSLDKIEGTPQGGLILTYDNEKAGAAIDLCYDFKTYSAMPDNGMVNFDFQHMLSRVKFTFNNHFPNVNSVIKVTSVTLNNVPAKGTLNKVKTTSGIWESATGQSQFSINLPPLNGADHNTGYVPGMTTNPTTGQTVYSHGETEHRYIIPFKEAQSLKLTFEIELYVFDPVANNNNGTYTLVERYKHENCVLDPIQFENGKSYNFVADINVDNIDPKGNLKPIIFNATVTDWPTKTENGITTEDWNDNTVKHEHGTGTGGGAAAVRRR